MMSVHRLALGTAPLGQRYGIANRSGQPVWTEARSIVQQARAAGVDTIDTAVAYGESEQILGRIGVQGLRVVTKLPALPQGEPDVRGWVQAQVESSLARLHATRLYALLVHRPADIIEPHGAPLVEALVNLKTAGVVQKIGPSIYAPAELDRLMEAMPVDIVQAPYNVLDRRLSESGWLERLRRGGAEVHTRSAFLQGLLLLEASQLPAAFERWRTLWMRWTNWRAERRLHPLEAALGFVLRDQNVGRVIVGVETSAQWREIAMHARPLYEEIPPDFACNELDLIDPSRWVMT